MILRTGLALLVLAAATPAFHYERPVQLASEAAPETCVVLPTDLLSHAAPRLQDLRVMAGDREVAYQVRVSTDAAQEMPRAQQILNLGEHNGAVSFDVEMMEPRYDRVLLRMGRSHFSVLIRVTGVHRPGESGVAFPEIAYSSDADEDELPQRLISLPESSFPYLHFEIRTLALEPVTPQDIAGVDALVASAKPPQYMHAAVATGPEQRPHETIYEFAVPPNVPLDRLSFVSDDPKAVFSRTADLERYPAHSVESPQKSSEEAAGARTTTPIQSEGITVAHAPAAKNETASDGKSTIDIDLGAMSSASTVRFTIQNGDDAPLALHDLTLEMRQREVCFLRKPNTSYALRYGDPLLGAARYDLSPLVAAHATASESTLGAEQALAPEAANGLRPFTERHPALLWVALIVVVGTLGFVALRSARSSRVRD